MNDTFLISIVTFVYFFAAFLFLVSTIIKNKPAERLAVLITFAGLGLQTAAIIMRWIHSYQLGIGHVPLSNFYESLVFFSWSIIFVYLIMRRRYSNNLFGIFSVFFAFLILAYASLSGNVNCTISAAYPRAAKQLAHKSRHKLFPRLFLLCHCFRNKYSLPLKSQGKYIHHSRCIFP